MSRFETIISIRRRINIEGEMVNHLRETRQKRGIAIWGLAARARVSPSLVSAIEKWGYAPRPGTQERIAAALGVSVGEIWPDPEGPAHPRGEREGQGGLR